MNTIYFIIIVQYVYTIFDIQNIIKTAIYIFEH